MRFDLVGNELDQVTDSALTSGQQVFQEVFQTEQEA